MKEQDLVSFEQQNAANAVDSAQILEKENTADSALILNAKNASITQNLNAQNVADSAHVLENLNAQIARVPRAALYEDVSISSRELLERGAEKNIYDEPIIAVSGGDAGLSPRALKNALLLAICVLALLLPKIFLTNNIYVTSKEISALAGQHDILAEDAKRLKQELERLNFLYF